MAFRRVTVFGGSGFVGRYVVKRLAAQGTVVRVAVRDVEGAKFLKPYGPVGQIVPVACNVRNDPSVAAAVHGAEAVINLVGLLQPSGANSFRAVQAEGAGRIATAAAAASAERLIQVSAIGADPESPAEYARSKAAGEMAAKAAFPGVSIVRPSLVIGPEDDFFNRFAQMARMAPALPLIGGGKTRFQPIYVGDLADAIMAVLERPETAGRTYEIGGPQVMTFRELLELMFRITGRPKPLLPIPFPVAELMGTVLGVLPFAPLTHDQVILLKRDNVVSPGAEGVAELGIDPTAIEGVLPAYLDRFRTGGRFSAVHRA
jgi:NADH dehydrogenase